MSGTVYSLRGEGKVTLHDIYVRLQGTQLIREMKILL